MRINTNVAALSAQQNLGRTQSAVDSSMAKLSSGFRITKAGDDAAGLSVANNLRTTTRALTVASRNIEQAQSLLQIAEGAGSSIQKIAERMKELAAQAATDTNASQRGTLDNEFQDLKAEITRIASSTEFQGKKLIDGSFTDQTLQIGAGNTANEQLSVALGDLSSLGLQSADLLSLENAQSAMSLIDSGSGASFTSQQDLSAIADGETITVGSATFTYATATHGAMSQADLLTAIETDLTGYAASVDADGKLVLTSETLGANTDTVGGTFYGANTVDGAAATVDTARVLGGISLTDLGAGDTIDFDDGSGTPVTFTLAAGDAADDTSKLAAIDTWATANGYDATDDGSGGLVLTAQVIGLDANDDTFAITKAAAGAIAETTASVDTVSARVMGGISLAELGAGDTIDFDDGSGTPVTFTLAAGDAADDTSKLAAIDTWASANGYDATDDGSGNLELTSQSFVSADVDDDTFTVGRAAAGTVAQTTAGAVDAVATAATFTGGPLTGLEDGEAISLTVGTDTHTFTFSDATHGSMDETELLAAITADLTGYTASVDTENNLILTSDTAGTGSNTDTVAGSFFTAAKLDAAAGAMDQVNGVLSKIGAYQNRLDYAQNNVKTTIVNISAAESVIRDVDMAEEMTKFSKQQILSQAGTAMLAQANQSSQGVLQLLRG